MKTQRVGMVFLAHSSSSSLRRFSAVRTSSAEKGSSMNRTSGSTTSARAKPTRCFMPPESSFGIGGFEAIETDGVDHAHAAGAALFGVDAAGLQRGLNVFKDSKPGEQGEALEDDGDVDFGIGDRLFVPVDLAGGWARKAGKHAEHGGFARAGRAEQGDDLPGNDGQVGGRNDLDAILAGLGIILLDLFGANDRLAGPGSGFTSGIFAGPGQGSAPRSGCLLTACVPLRLWIRRELGRGRYFKSL